MTIYRVTSQVQAQGMRYYSAESENEAIKSWEDDCNEPHEIEILQEDLVEVVEIKDS